MTDGQCRRRRPRPRPRWLMLMRCPAVFLSLCPPTAEVENVFLPFSFLFLKEIPVHRFKWLCITAIAAAAYGHVTTYVYRTSVGRVLST